MHGATTLARKAKTDRPLTLGRINHLVRQAEKKSGTGGTGQTILKMTAKPLGRLVDDHRIGPVEVMAAQDFELAFMTIGRALWIKPQSYERRDPSYGGVERVKEIDAQTRYKAFADHWSMMRKRGDKTLEILTRALIDEQPFRLIEDDLNIKHGVASKAVIRGLRDYAARAKWTDPATAALWKAEAGTTFKTNHPQVTLAMAASRRLRG